ncbi:MAG: hypothetical protein AAF572_02565 [Cyanobacteria bacterium P01_B01_bin.77]
MTNELTHDQLDSVSGGDSIVERAARYLIDELIELINDQLNTSVMASEDDGQGDYRTGPSTSNSPRSPFG